MYVKLPRPYTPLATQIKVLLMIQSLCSLERKFAPIEYIIAKALKLDLPTIFYTCCSKLVLSLFTKICIFLVLLLCFLKLNILITVDLRSNILKLFPNITVAISVN